LVKHQRRRGGDYATAAVYAIIIKKMLQSVSNCAKMLDVGKTMVLDVYKYIERGDSK